MKSDYPSTAFGGNQLGYGLQPIRLTAPLAPPLSPPPLSNSTWGLHFTIIALVLALLCTRIGLPFGGQQMSFVGPAVLVLAAWGFIKGHLVFHRTRLALFILLCAFTLVSSAVVLIEPQRFGLGVSWPSMIQFLGLTSLLTLRFAEPVDERQFFTAVNSIFCFIAIAGLLQFFLQFIGLGLFSFKGILPDQLSFETGFNLLNHIEGTKYFKSNGFFLLEASMLSQFMALGLSIEILIRRRLHVIALMLAGLMVTLSGTGWIILSTFIMTIGIGMKGRGAMLAVVTVALLATGLFVLAVVSPDFFDSFAGRYGEFSAPGSSGHARFVAPFWTIRDVIWREPWALWVGIGAGGGERLIMLPYIQSLNTPVKLLVEFGVPVMLIYVALLIAGSKTRNQWILFPAALVFILFTGSYLQIPPLIYPVFLIICIPTLKPSIPTPPSLQR